MVVFVELAGMIIRLPTCEFRKNASSILNKTRESLGNNGILRNAMVTTKSGKCKDWVVCVNPIVAWASERAGGRQDVGNSKTFQANLRARQITFRSGNASE